MNDLVSTDWLAAHIGDRDLVVVDASSHLPMAQRDARAEFEAAHIPGARFLDLASFFDPDSPVPAAIPNADQFAGRMGALGIGNEARVVVYDDSYVKTAARAWFIFRLHGIRQVAILDGGLGKWKAEGRTLESGSPAVASCTFSPVEGAGDVADKARVLANIDSGACTTLDARDAKRFSGALPDFRPNIARGHIPGSANIPFDLVLNDDGTYKNAAELREVFAQSGLDPDRPVITTCGGGVTAAVLLFALRLTGREDVALYDGSWGEWGADESLPKAVNAEPEDEDA